MFWLTIPVAVYSVTLFVLWLVLRKNSGQVTPVKSDRIRISVVVACRNEAQNIITLLEQLASQDYPVDLIEITIVNDHSTDRTPVAVSEFISRHGSNTRSNVRLIYSLKPGKKQALLHGVEKSSGELILTTDADCIIGSGWVRAYAGLYAATGADMILGDVYEVTRKDFISQFGSLEFSALQSVTEAAVLTGCPVMCNGANMAIRRDVYLRHSNELHDYLASGDDIFMLHAVKRAGGKVRYLGDREAAVGTAAAVPAAALLRQRARWASKAFHYRDGATVALAAATAACNAAVTAAAITAAFSIHHLTVAATLYIIRLVPDFLIISHHRKKREERMPLIIFFISEIIYPFYFTTVALLSFLPSMRRFNRHL